MDNAFFPLIIGLGVFGSFGLAAYILISYSDERAEARASLRTLDDYEISEESKPRRRAVTKDPSEQLMKQLTALGRRYTPVGRVDMIKHKLFLAGKQRPDEVDRYLARMVLSFAAAPAWAAIYLIFLRSSFKGMLEILLFALPIALALLGPGVMLNRAVEARQRSLRRALPDVMDLMTISVEAGLGFEQAVDRVVAAVPGDLTDEFNRMLGEMRAGASRSEALQGIDDRCGLPEVKSFVMAIRQADTFGISIARILRAQSVEMRIKRRQLAQEAAQKVPVKMLIPMVFCIFPSIFLIILGPAMINIVANL